MNAIHTFITRCCASLRLLPFSPVAQLFTRFILAITIIVVVLLLCSADLEFDEEAIENERKRKEEEEARIAAEEAAAKAAAEAAEAERLRLIEEERQRRLKLLPPRSEAKPRRVARDGTIDGVDISALTAIYAAESLADVEEEVAWVLCQATEDDHNKVEVVATGSGGLDELAAKLSDSDIQFGAFRAAAIERKGQKLR